MQAIGSTKHTREILSMTAPYHMFRSRWKYIADTYGVAMVDMIKDSVPKESKRFLSNNYDPYEWYPMRHILHIDQAISDNIYRGFLDPFRQFGRYTANKELSTFNRFMIYAIGNPQLVVRGLPKFFNKYYCKGHVEWSMDAIAERTYLDIKFMDIVIPKSWCYIFDGWIESCMRLSRADNVIVEHTNCCHLGAVNCEWRVSWA